MQTRHFNEQLQQHIIQKKAKYEENEVSKQLNTAFDIGLRKHHIFIKKKAQREVDAKGQEKRSSMGFKRIINDINLMPSEKILVTHNVGKKPQ